MRPPNLLMVLNMSTAKHGATESYLCGIAQMHARTGGRTVVALTGCSDPIRALFADAGAPVEIVDLNTSNTERLEQLRPVVRRHEIDVAVLNFFGLAQPVPIALRLAGVPHVVFVDDLSGNATFRSTVHRLVVRSRIRLNTLACDRVVGVSDWVRRRDVEAYGVSRKRACTVYNGVHPGEATEDEARALRRELGVAPDQPVVLGVGQLIPDKGFDHLTEAVARVRRTRPEVRMVIVGGPGPNGGDFPERLRALAAERLGDAAHFAGIRSDVRAFMAMADVVAVPSVWEEAFGFVVTEGMITGNAVIGSRVGGIPELIRDGETGLLAPRGDDVALAAAIERLLADEPLRARLGRAARVEARARFTAERMVREMLEIAYDVSGYVHPDWISASAA